MLISCKNGSCSGCSINGVSIFFVPLLPVQVALQKMTCRAGICLTSTGLPAAWLAQVHFERQRTSEILSSDQGRPPIRLLSMCQFLSVHRPSMELQLSAIKCLTDIVPMLGLAVRALFRIGTDQKPGPGLRWPVVLSPSSLTCLACRNESINQNQD